MQAQHHKLKTKYVPTDNELKYGMKEFWNLSVLDLKVLCHSISVSANKITML